jgi:hypothetical protein
MNTITGLVVFYAVHIGLNQQHPPAAGLVNILAAARVGEVLRFETNPLVRNPDLNFFRTKTIFYNNIFLRVLLVAMLDSINESLFHSKMNGKPVIPGITQSIGTAENTGANLPQLRYYTLGNQFFMGTNFCCHATIIVPNKHRHNFTANKNYRLLTIYYRLFKRQEGFFGIVVDVKYLIESGNSEDIKYLGAYAAEFQPTSVFVYFFAYPYQQTKNRARKELDIAEIDDNIRRAVNQRHHRILKSLDVIVIKKLFVGQGNNRSILSIINANPWFKLFHWLYSFYFVLKTLIVAETGRKSRKEG